MPSHFDRFRILNGGDHRRIRNESGKFIYLRAREEDEQVIVEPGAEVPMPESETGETIVDVETVVP